MKASKFNIFIPEENGTYLLYNTFRGSIARVNNPLAKLLKNNKATDYFQESQHNEILEELRQQGILISSSRNEIDEYNDLHDRWKTGKETLSFTVLLTYDCNFECPYCYQGRGEKGEQLHGNRSMDRSTLSTIEAFIKKTAIVSKAKRIELVLYGGEPFMPEVDKMGRDFTDNINKWCTENGLELKLHVLSNGSLIDR